MKRVLWIFPIVFLILSTACGGSTEPSDNHSPEINALTASDSTVSVNETIDIICEAVDPDGDELTYSWDASAGVMDGSGANVTWTAPEVPGTCGITCTVSDSEDNDSSMIEIGVVPQLKIEPAEQTIAIDEEAVFSVQIYGGVNVFAFSCEIVFDSTKVTLPENPVTVGSFWSVDYISTSMNENDRLNVAIGLEQTSGDDGLNGDGVLFNFKVKGIQIGESDLRFENLSLINEEGNPIEGFDDITLNNGILIIQ